jgi:hypothetical protein
MFRNHSIRSAWVGMLAVVPALATASLWAAAPAAASAKPTSSNRCDPVPTLHRSNFPSRPLIDNKFLPLVPGTQILLDGFVIGDDGLQHPHRIETTVTDLTKVIDGVRTIIIYDRDIQDGKLAEAELFFAAQDNDGTLWTFGEYPELYDATGALTGAPSTWISGIDGSRAGINMLAHPHTGSGTYVQGLALSVGFKDCASVVGTGKHVCVPAGCFSHVLVTDEFAPLDPTGGHQHKLYAPGVGTIEVTAVGGVDPETLKLTSNTRLCREAFADVRSQALAQDRRGYKVAKNVYGDTPRARDTLTAVTC